MSEPAKPRRWRWRAFVGVLAIMVVAVGWLWWRATSLNRAIEAAYAATDRLDPGWRLDDLLASRKKIPDAENSALLIEKFGRLAPGVFVYRATDYEERRADWKLPARCPPLLHHLLRDELGKLPLQALPAVRTLKDFPNGSFAVRFGPDFISTVLVGIDESVAVADWLEHDALLHCADGQIAAAFASAQALLNVARSHNDDPFLICSLQCNAFRQRVARVLEASLSQGEADDVLLRVAQESLMREFGDSHLLLALRFDRAGYHKLIRHYDDNGLSLEALTRRPGGNAWLQRAEDFVKPRPKQSIPDWLDYSNAIVEIANLPSHEQAKPLEKLQHSIRDRSQATRLLAPAMTKVAAHDRATQTLLRSAVAALACERYRLQHKVWPERLGQLIHAKLLDAIPLDPNDGEPLRLQRTDFGLAIYGVGDDRVDDGGALDPANGTTPGTDIGFRLWDVPRRKGGVP